MPTFADEMLWPEFTQLAEALRADLDEAMERIVREEVFKDPEDPGARWTREGGTLCRNAESCAGNLLRRNLDIHATRFLDALP